LTVQSLYLDIIGRSECENKKGILPAKDCGRKPMLGVH